MGPDEEDACYEPTDSYSSSVDEENACYEPAGSSSSPADAYEAERRRLEASDRPLEHDGLGTTVLGVIAGVVLEGPTLAAAGTALVAEGVISAAEKVIDYFEGPEPLSSPNFDWQDHEETTMRSSSVSYEDAPPPQH
jgi:hypothetical protein